MKPFKKTVFLGITDQGRLNVSIEWDGKNLSITGREGRDYSGQIIMSPWNFKSYSDGHNSETVAQLRDIWNKWHLNDTKAGSPSQTAYLEAHPVPHCSDYFTKASQALKAAGLNPDPNYLYENSPYKYGSAWLRVEVPEDALQFLENLL